MESVENGTSGSELSAEEERPPKRRRILAKPHREVGLMRSDPGDKVPGFVGSASGIYFIRSVYGAIRHSEQAAANSVDTPTNDVVPGEDDQLPSVLPYASGRLWRHDEIASSSAGSIPYEELVELSGSYFANWHTLYPFLHAPTVLGYFEKGLLRVSSSDNTQQDLRIVILRSIMSVSLADQRQAGNPERLRYPGETVFSSYDAAVDSLQHVLTKPTSILGLQAAISIQLFLVSMLRLNAASRLGGLINRMALQLGLHRCPTRYTSFSVREKELRQRIFWSLYNLDRFICQSMGLPLGLSDDDLDVCFPTVESHIESPQELQPDARLKLLSFIARESRLRGEIIELRNKSLHYIQKDPDQATAITARITQWWNDCEDWNDEADGQQLSPYHLTILTLLKHESIISLHRPILAASRQGAEYDAALQLCIASARSIITILHDAIRSRDEITGRHNTFTLLWPSCTWAVWISTFILFYAASGNYISHEVVIKLADRSLQVLQHLSRRGSAWPEASAAAIRELRSRMVQRASSDMPEDTAPYHEDRHLQPETTELVTTTAQSATSVSEAATHTVSSTDYNMSSYNQRHYEDFVDSSLPSERVLQDLPPTTQQAATFDNSSAAFSDFMQGGQTLDQNSDQGNLYNLDPFSGFDIPFWFEQDQYWDILQNFD